MTSFTDRLKLTQLYRAGRIDPHGLLQDEMEKTAEELISQIAAIEEVFQQRLKSMQTMFEEALNEVRALDTMEPAQEQKRCLEKTIRELSEVVEGMRQDLDKLKEKLPLERKNIQDLQGIFKKYESALRQPEGHWVSDSAVEFGKRVCQYMGKPGQQQSSKGRGKHL